MSRGDILKAGRSPYVAPSSIDLDNPERTKKDLEDSFAMIANVLDIVQQSMSNYWTVKQPGQTFLGMMILVHDSFDYTSWEPALPAFTGSAVMMWLEAPLPERLKGLSLQDGSEAYPRNGRWVLFNEWSDPPTP